MKLESKEEEKTKNRNILEEWVFQSLDSRHYNWSFVFLIELS